ncbi:MAG: type II and III secretion system protein [Deltaproteobacteria bacterium RIFOXYA12_FULL_58_15]|nr:MAG: type II and III secretion system protein [Deltaproteobacteria bacterium RIFOXYA12_FULL_58_15]OGR10067.1 MAG: type II and III secretion system protein [Deltaproteobacteria bacterium RIFOXYB12_FULL_58_9]
MKKRTFFVTARTTIATGLAIAATSAWAQSKTDEVGPPTTLHVNQEVGAVRELKLESGQNRLLILSQSVSRVSVADTTVADLKVVTPTQLLLTAKKPGVTDLTLWDKGDLPLVVALSVARNLDSLRYQLQELFPNEAIGVSSAGDLVVLTGEVQDVRLPERISEVAKLHTEKLANLIRVSGNQQVQLEVKFAEVSRTGVREFGVNFHHKAADYTNQMGLFSPRTPAGTFLNTPTPPNYYQTGPLLGPVGAVGGHPPSIPAQAFGESFSLYMSSFSRFPFSVMLNMLESRGLSKTLAEPSLVTLSGQEARFLAGGELPIPMASGLGNVNVQWKEFGVVLKFTPTVTGDGQIHLKLAAEVSDLDPSASISVGGYTIPGLSTRQSDTTVRLGDGQSFAIAGLLSDKIRTQVQEVPFFGRIPILGALFRSTAFQREETELLVVVTAHLAKPVAPHELPPMPTDYEDNDVGDLVLFLMGWDSLPPTHESAADDSADVALNRGPSGAVGFAR